MALGILFTVKFFKRTQFFIVDDMDSSDGHNDSEACSLSAPGLTKIQIHILK